MRRKRLEGKTAELDHHYPAQLLFLEEMKIESIILRRVASNDKGGEEIQSIGESLYPETDGTPFILVNIQSIPAGNLGSQYKMLFRELLWRWELLNLSNGRASLPLPVALNSQLYFIEFQSKFMRRYQLFPVLGLTLHTRGIGIY